MGIFSTWTKRHREELVDEEIVSGGFDCGFIGSGLLAGVGSSAGASLLSGYKSNNSIWLGVEVSGFLKSCFISNSCKAIFSSG